MNKIEYFQIPFDECERGIKVIFNENDTLEIYDDSTDSYLSWHLTYDEVQGELYVCWTDRIKQKSFTKEAFEFERNLGYHLDSLTTEILYLIWKPKGYYDFQVYHPNRIISAPYYKDRIVEEWLTDRFVKPFLEPKLHPGNVACQEDKGPPEAQKIVKSILEKMYQKYGTDFYVLQCDIQGYYDNVNHERIKEQFSGMQAMGYIFFMNIVDGWKKTDCYAAENDPTGEYGVPKGNLPSQWIGLAYLNEVDWYIAQRDDNEGQVRYMDDFLTFFHLKSSCKDCKIKIEKYLEEHSMGVRLHPKKTKYMPIKQGFTFCGWQYSIDDKGRIKCRVRTDRKRLTKKRMKRLSEDYCKGKVTSFDVKQKMNGTFAFLNQGDTKQLQRYLTYKYIFTKDESLLHKDRSYNVRRHIVGGANRTLFSVDLPPRLCRTGT